MEPGSSRAAAAPPLILDSQWRRLVRRPDRIAARAMAAAGQSVSVVLTDDRSVRRLNLRHQPHGPVGANRPTNVLTFADSGEVVLARGVVEREAAAAGRPVAHHLAHLVLHGALHLAGHGHERIGDARRMEMAEARLLQRLRIPNPWRAR
jgi:probable rRNA maturation factor